MGFGRFYFRSSFFCRCSGIIGCNRKLAVPYGISSFRLSA
jgi:hypothetical protein